MEDSEGTKHWPLGLFLLQTSFWDLRKLVQLKVHFFVFWLVHVEDCAISHWVVSLTLYDIVISGQNLLSINRMQNYF